MDVPAPLAPPHASPAPGPAPREVRLSQARLGDRGVIAAVGAQADQGPGGLDAPELERRLLELGFVEGAALEVIHEGGIGRDPIAVRLDDMRVALRRRDATEILILIEESAG